MSYGDTVKPSLGQHAPAVAYKHRHGATEGCSAAVDAGPSAAGGTTSSKPAPETSASATGARGQQLPAQTKAKQQQQATALETDGKAGSSRARGGDVSTAAGGSSAALVGEPGLELGRQDAIRVMAAAVAAAAEAAGLEAKVDRAQHSSHGQGNT